MEQLGIEPSLLLAQIVNFSIIVFLLAKLLYKPVLEMMEKRRKEIERGLALTEKMKQEEEKLQQKKEKMTQEARREVRAILEEAKKQAKDEEKEIIAQAHQEAEAIILKGKEEVARTEKAMEGNLRAKSVDIAVAMTKRLLSAILSAPEQHKLIQKHLKELESVRPS